MPREKYSCYEFEIFAHDVPGSLENENKWVKGYFFKIYTEGYLPYDDGIIESDEYFDTEQQARFAAVGRIDQLENGEG